MFRLKTSSDLQKQLADHVKRIRQSRKITQQELADRANIGIATIQRFEQRGEIGLSKLMTILAVLDVGEAIVESFEKATPTFSSIEEIERLNRKERS